MTKQDTYPTPDEIQHADLDQLITWNRSLRRPATNAELLAVQKLLHRLDVFRCSEPRMYTAASRRVGWAF